jgi:hypothetical protein
MDTSKRTGGHGREINTGKGMVEENGMERTGSIIRAKVNPVRNSSGALAAQALAQRVKPCRNYLECNPAIAGLQSSGALFLTG